MDHSRRLPLSTLLDAIPMAAGVVDAAGALLVCNRGWAHATTPLAAALPTAGPDYLERLAASTADGALELVRTIRATLAEPEAARTTLLDPDLAGVSGLTACVALTTNEGDAGGHHWTTRVAPAGEGIVLVTHEDVSDRHRAQADLRKSRARLRTILTGAPLALFAVDHDGRFSLVEGMAAGAAGLITPDLVGRRLEDEYSHIPDLIATVRAALRGTTAVTTVEVGALAFEVHCSPDIGSSGQFRGAVGVATDVTERVRAQRLKDDFVSVVNHELRTPLTSIHGALSLLENNVAGQLPPEAIELTKIARTSVDRLIRLITDLLDLDRLDSGRFELRRQRVDLSQLIETAARELAALAVDADVRIDIVDSPALTLEADADRLHQVLTNLLSNAIKFSPHGAVVSVVVERRSGFVRVSVTDRGPGIRPEDHSRLFRKFSQLTPSGESSRTGSGLGLVISKSIVEAHGGRISLRSEVGSGSTFFFDLPVARVTTQAHPVVASQSGTMRVAPVRPQLGRQPHAPPVPLGALLSMFELSGAANVGAVLRDAHATVQLLLARLAGTSGPRTSEALTALRRAIEVELDRVARGATAALETLEAQAGQAHAVATQEALEPR